MDAAVPASSLGQDLKALAARARDVWKIVPRSRKLALAGAGLIMIVTSAGNTGVALLLGRLIDRIQSGLNDERTSETLLLTAGEILGGIALIYVAREALNVWRRYLVEDSCTRINREMQTRLVEHVLKWDLNALSREKVGALHGRIFRSVDGLVRFMRLMFLDCLPAIFTGVFALLAATGKHPLLGLVMLTIIPTALWLTIRQLASQKGVRIELMRDCEEIDGTVVEQLGGAEYIRAADTHDLEIQRLSSATEKRRKREIRHHFEMSLYGCAKALNEGACHILVLGLATYLAIDGKISFGDILTFSVLFLNVMTPLNEVHRVLDEGQEAGLRVADFLAMMREPTDPSFATRSNAKIPFRVGDPAIEIENLVVEYVTADGETKRGLDRVSISIRHGETIGVAGRSGSGKSTWIKALIGTVHPLEGQIRIGGLPIEEISRAELARCVGYVGQNPFVFSGTIRENIAYGNGRVDAHGVEKAAELAHLEEEILAMPRGYDTQLVERGQNISGGQRQRLAIARILLKQAPLLILDEATSALDNISERFVQQSLGVTNKDRTTILIAHRLTTLKDCDRILVFDKGRIVEEGSFQDLVEQGGVLAELVASAATPVSPEGHPGGSPGVAVSAVAR